MASNTAGGPPPSLRRNQSPSTLSLRRPAAPVTSRAEAITISSASGSSPSHSTTALSRSPAAGTSASSSAASSFTQGQCARSSLARHVSHGPPRESYASRTDGAGSIRSGGSPAASLKGKERAVDEPRVEAPPASPQKRMREEDLPAQPSRKPSGWFGTFRSSSISSSSARPSLDEASITPRHSTDDDGAPFPLDPDDESVRAAPTLAAPETLPPPPQLQQPPPPPAITSQPLSRRKSWFYNASPALSTPMIMDASGLPTPSVFTIPYSPPLEPEPEPAPAPPAAVEPAAAPEHRPPVQETVSQEPVVGAKRGWLSALSKSSTEAARPPQPSTDAAQLDDGTVKASSEGLPHQAEKEQEVEQQHGTLRAASRAVHNRERLQSQQDKRSSWWGWGGREELPPLEPEAAPMEVEVVPPAAAVEAAPSISSASTTSSSEPRKHQPTWLQTLWGEFPAERRAREATIMPTEAGGGSTMVAYAAGLEQGFAAANGSADPMMVDPPPPVTEPEQQATPVEVPMLKSKSSWFFGREPTRSTASSPGASVGLVPPTAPSSLPLPPPAGGLAPVAAALAQDQRGRHGSSKSLNVLTRSPLLGFGGGGGSSASSRSTSPARGAPAEGEKIPGSSSGAPAGPNLVLPSFEDTFACPPRSFVPKQSTINRAVSVVSAYLFSAPPSSPVLADRGGSQKGRIAAAAHLPKSWEAMGLAATRTLEVKRVVTIGVHGWFPHAFVRGVVGEPTGTSRKFATMMHDAVQSYLESHDVSSFNITTIALEGEGQVKDRVQRLYDQLVAQPVWVEAIKRADSVFLATHSQGTIVSTHLLARLLREGLLKGDKTHLLAMCGISQVLYLRQSYVLQPYFSYIESESARELFEYQDPESPMSKDFLASLQDLLSHGVKTTTIGSINDQVVPLYSALFAGIAHPAILRAVYVDGAAYRTSDFLANLVVFAARIRNSGLGDHDTIYHLSEALAGALTGVGHSKIYDEPAVFDLAVRYAYETTALADAPTYLNASSPVPPLRMSFNPREKRNAYLLTWALRGVVDDPAIRELFSPELNELAESYSQWHPATKVLKDTKLKLAGFQLLPREGKL